jgi:hypothetical protein
MRILALQANGDPDSVLQLDKEIREIKRTLSNAVSWEVEILQEGAVQARDLQALLLRHKPDVVHFAGHGNASGKLMLETNQGDSQAVSPKSLSGIFSTLGENICCVVLNACYSARQAEAIAKWIPYVVGMTSRISDPASIAFSTSFYQALAFGKTFEEAFVLGQQQVELEYRGESRVPEVHKLDSKGARSLPNSLQPFIEAEFDLDRKGKPKKNKNGEYELTVSVARHPRTAHTCVYQYIDQWGGTIKKKDQFDVIPNDRNGFQSEASLYGNVLIRASLWSTEGGLAIQTYLIDALKRHYSRRVGSSVTKAIKRIGED